MKTVISVTTEKIDFVWSSELLCKILSFHSDGMNNAIVIPDYILIVLFAPF